MLEERIRRRAAERGLVSNGGVPVDLLNLRRMLKKKEDRTASWLKRNLLAFLWGALPTGAWLHDHGWLTSPFCLCGEIDDEAHRFGGCFLSQDRVQAFAERRGGIANLAVNLDQLRLPRPRFRDEVQ